jgi:hypothetical protein
LRELIEKVNGKRLPVLIAVLVIGFNAGVTWSAKEQAVKEMQHEIREYAERDSTQTHNLISELDRREQRRNQETNLELQQMGKRLGYAIRAIQ